MFVFRPCCALPLRIRIRIRIRSQRYLCARYRNSGTRKKPQDNATWIYTPADIGE